MASTPICLKMVPTINVCVRSRYIYLIYPHICIFRDSEDIVLIAVHVKPRYGHTASVVGECVYIFGGDSSDDDSKSSV